MKRIFIILFCLLSPLLLSAQDVDRNKGIYLSINPQVTIHTNVNFQIIENGQFFDYSADNPGSIAYGFTMEIGYFILKRKFSVGMGFSIENNNQYQAKYWPIYLDARYFFIESRNSPYAFINLGKMLPNNGNKVDGSLLTIGGGQKIFFTSKLAANFSIGYSIRKLDYSNPNVL